MLDRARAARSPGRRLSGGERARRATFGAPVAVLARHSATRQHKCEVACQQSLKLLPAWWCVVEVAAAFLEF
eukprot:7026110-Prymnesium_polylepis.1